MTPCEHTPKITGSNNFGNEIEVTVFCERCETTFTYVVKVAEIVKNFDLADVDYKIVGDHEPYRSNFNF